MVDLFLGRRLGGYRFCSRVSFYGSLGEVVYPRTAGTTLEDTMAPTGAALPCIFPALRRSAAPRRRPTTIDFMQNDNYSRKFVPAPWTTSGVAAAPRRRATIIYIAQNNTYSSKFVRNVGSHCLAAVAPDNHAMYANHQL